MNTKDFKITITRKIDYYTFIVTTHDNVLVISGFYVDGRITRLTTGPRRMYFLADALNTMREIFIQMSTYKRDVVC